MTLIIPSLNELDGMKWFLGRIDRSWYDEMLIVDGGSTDGTVEYCRENGYDVFVQSQPGLPRALAEAFEKSTKDIIITLSPDGNSLPELIPKLTEKMQEGYDMTIVSRYLGSARSADDDVMTAFGNRIFTKMVNFIFRAQYTDTLVIFRAYRREAIERMHLHRQEEESPLKKKCLLINGWEMGSSIRAAKLGLRVAQIPGDEPMRIGGIRKLSIIRNGFGELFHVLHELFTGLRFSRGS